jgi:cytochrome b561
VRSGELTTRSGRLSAASAAGYRGSAAGHTSRRRIVLAWMFGVAGLVGYNWWLLVPLKPGLMTSPDELFSNLEVTGQPYASLMQHADLASGLLLLAAFWAAGPVAGSRGRREWLAVITFAIAGAIGGLFPEVCADGVNAACRRLEYRFELPTSQYIHMAAGVLEFAAITVALLWALQRTRQESEYEQSTRAARTYRMLGIGALVAYPLLGAAYLTDRFGGIMEAVFFVGFTMMVITHLAERTTAVRTAADSPAAIRQCCQVLPGRFHSRRSLPAPGPATRVS